MSAATFNKPSDKVILTPAEYDAASADGVLAWADLIGRAVHRLRMTGDDPLLNAVADVLDYELQGDHGIDQCPGRRCPKTVCPTRLDDGFVDEGAHHHCRWCVAWVLSAEHPEPTAVQLARAVLEGGVS